MTTIRCRGRGRKGTQGKERTNAADEVESRGKNSPCLNDSRDSGRQRKGKMLGKREFGKEESTHQQEGGVRGEAPKKIHLTRTVRREG